MTEPNKYVYVCRQCQKLYFKAFVRQVITEEVEMELDEEGIEHSMFGHVTNRVQSHYDCPQQKFHDTWKQMIPTSLYNRLYSTYKDRGAPIRIGIQDTLLTMSTEYDEIEGRLFDGAI